MQAAITKFGHRGIYKACDGLRCHCQNNYLEGRSEWDICRHLDGKWHKKWFEKREKKAQDQGRMSEFMAAQNSDETARLELEGTRMSNLTEFNNEFCMDTVKAFLSTGIPMQKLDGHLREYLTRHSHKALSHRNELASECIPKLLSQEQGLQKLKH